MPLFLTKKLILIEARQIEFEGKNGSKVKKWKYTFLTPDEKLMTSYDDNGVYADKVKTIQKWDEKESQPFTFVMREFQGQTKLQLFLGDKAFKKSVPPDKNSAKAI